MPPRVLVTRARHQASDLADHLRSLGADPVLIPSIETVDPTSFAALDTAIADLHSFDWLIFTSANAVEVFGKRCVSASMPKIAAIGPATAAAIATLGVKPDLIPPQAVAESLTEALLPLALRSDGSPTRFLLIRAEQGRDHLPETLRKAGAEVTIAPAYRTVIPDDSVALIRALFVESEPPIDAIAFTSSSTARNLLALCEAAAVTLPGSALRISIGPVTSDTLRELALPPHAEAPGATVAALARTIMAALNSTPRP